LCIRSSRSFVVVRIVKEAPMKLWFVFPLALLMLSPVWLERIESRMERFGEGGVPTPPNYAEGGVPTPPNYAEGGVATPPR